MEDRRMKGDWVRLTHGFEDGYKIGRRRRGREGEGGRESALCRGHTGLSITQVIEGDALISATVS